MYVSILPRGKLPALTRFTGYLQHELLPFHPRHGDTDGALGGVEGVLGVLGGCHSSHRSDSMLMAHVATTNRVHAYVNLTLDRRKAFLTGISERYLGTVSCHRGDLRQCGSAAIQATVYSSGLCSLGRDVISSVPRKDDSSRADT